MKKSVILELAGTEPRYLDKVNLRIIDGYTKSLNSIFEIYKNLCKDMTQEETKNISNEIFDYIGELEKIVMDEYFKAGFKLGLQLGVQNFSD